MFYSLEPFILISLLTLSTTHLRTISIFLCQFSTFSCSELCNNTLLIYLYLKHFIMTQQFSTYVWNRTYIPFTNRFWFFYSMATFIHISLAPALFRWLGAQSTKASWKQMSLLLDLISYKARVPTLNKLWRKQTRIY